MVDDDLRFSPEYASRYCAEERGPSAHATRPADLSGQAPDAGLYEDLWREHGWALSAADLLPILAVVMGAAFVLKLLS